MKNKSRKRILHEQKVEIERLRRWVKRLQMQIDPSLGADRSRVDTIARAFVVPQGLLESDRIRDFEVFRALKEMVQELAGRIEIRYEDIDGGKISKVTLLLRVVCPLSASTLPEDYLKGAAAKIVRFPYLPYHDERYTVCYGGPHDGGKKYIEELRLLNEEVKRIVVGGDWNKSAKGGE